MQIKIVLQGGLGNQMFQYAFGRSLAKRYNAKLHVSINELNRSSVPRPYMLGKMFRISCSEGLNVDWNMSINEPHPYVDGCESVYDNLPDGNYVVHGYWQNENYFSNVKDELREEFALDHAKLGDRDLIVQVRRTDYVNNSAHEYCTIDWYKKAISEFDFDKIYFTSDDIEWCKSTFDYPNMKFIQGSEREQFQYMYGCKNFVISNSSFGWWGSWFSDTEKVICPAIWFPADLKWNTARKKWKKLSK